MVKVAEKNVKRSPMTPVFGLLLAVGLLFVAFLISLFVVQIPVVRSTLVGVGQVTIGNNRIPIPIGDANAKYLTWGHVGVTAIFWFLLAGFSYFLVTMAAGKDPESAKQIPLPPRDRKPTRRR